MYIKQLIIDGFKSYPNRTVVSDFDEQFNAITGLNGSGKSNILDAICFVLGENKPKQMRVGSMQELIYKHGQSGITKASVSLIFDNTDPGMSPVGYSDKKEITVTRQIQIGGKSKYLINGTTVQQNVAKTFFESCHLCIDNPHFLIMQGRITKVLNMTPIEILGLLKEAAGMSMYERRKVAAESKMEKKQQKVDEIENVLGKITEELGKLTNQSEAFTKYKQNKNELKQLERFCTAYHYTQQMEVVKQGKSKRDDLESNVETLKSTVKGAKLELKQLQQDCTQVDLEGLEQELQELSEKQTDCSKIVVKYKSKMENLKDSQKKLMKKIQQMENQEQKLEQTLKDLSEQLLKEKESFSKAEEEFNIANQEYEKAQLSLQAANAGLDSQEDNHQTLGGRVVALKTTIEESNSKIKSNKLEMEHLEKENVEMKKKVEKSKNDDKAIEQELKKYEKSITDLEEMISKLNFDPSKMEALRASLVDLRKQASVKQDLVEKLGAKLSAFDFEIEDPKIKGLVAKLFTVKELDTSTALEIVAGGKLYQVVVDDVETSKALLSGKLGRLKRRVTIIPLDKINARNLHPSKLEAAKRIAKSTGGSADVALSLIGYDDEISKAMEYVFGSTIICDSLETARSVTFSKDVRTKTVTLEGDSFDPHGTLSGGSRPDQGAVLVHLHKYQSEQNELKRLQGEILKIEQELENGKGLKSKYEDLSNKLELAKHEFKLVTERANSTAHASLVREFETITKSIQDLATENQALKLKIDESKTELLELEEDVKDMDSARNKLVEKAQQNLKRCKKLLKEKETLFKEKQNKIETIELQVDEIKEEMKNLQNDDKATLLKKQNELEQELVQVVGKYDHGLENLQVAEQYCSEKQKEIDEKKGVANKMSKSCSEKQTEIQNLELEMKKLEGKMELQTKSYGDAKKHIRKLLEKNPWIEQEEKLFGQPNTDYDFELHDPVEAINRKCRLEKTLSNQEGKINSKAHDNFDKVKKNYDDLNEKRSIIEKDKSAIVRVIQRLEKQKNEELSSIWEKVNKDFSSIFSTLLPGAKAKLDLVESGNLEDGLQVRVAFGEKWKNSLTELSGGQRSLLALSLILALLLFKPAPMYILDECDAALDLSHTQNIGQMLKSHFSHSQFIIVSLKEGMFQNANVIFRTQLIDGASSVRRTLGSTSFVEKSSKNSKKRNRAPTTDENQQTNQIL